VCDFTQNTTGVSEGKILIDFRQTRVIFLMRLVGGDLVMQGVGCPTTCPFYFITYFKLLNNGLNAGYKMNKKINFLPHELLLKVNQK
jgi:hypothetical protein